MSSIFNNQIQNKDIAKGYSQNDYRAFKNAQNKLYDNIADRQLALGVPVMNVKPYELSKARFATTASVFPKNMFEVSITAKSGFLQLNMTELTFPHHQIESIVAPTGQLNIFADVAGLKFIDYDPTKLVVPLLELTVIDSKSANATELEMWMKRDYTPNDSLGHMPITAPTTFTIRLDVFRGASVIKPSYFIEYFDCTYVPDENNSIVLDSTNESEISKRTWKFNYERIVYTSAESLMGEI